MTMYEVRYELDKVDGSGEKIEGRNDGDFESAEEANQVTSDFLSSLYDSDEWFLASIEVTPAK